MTKDEVLTRLCTLVTDVGSQVFKSEHPYDCFCAPGQAKVFQAVSPLVVEFIETAVKAAIAQKGTK